MNLLAIRIGSTLSTPFNLSEETLSGPVLNDSALCLWSNIGDIRRSPRSSIMYSPSAPGYVRGNSFPNSRLLDGSFFNFEFSVGSIFSYPGSYGFYFVLPLFSPFKFNGSASLVTSSLSDYSSSPLSGIANSFYSSRLYFRKSFILPQNDIDYILHLFVSIFGNYASSSTLMSSSKLSQSRTELNSPSNSSGAYSWRLSSSQPRFASKLANSGSFGGKLFNAPLSGISALKIVCNGRLPSRLKKGLLEIPRDASEASFGGVAHVRNSDSSTGLFNRLGLSRRVIGRGVSSSGFTSFRSLLKRNSSGNSSRSLNSDASRGPVIGGAIPPRSKSFTFQWGNIPTNASTNLNRYLSYRYKPFFTQKGSNSLHLFIEFSGVAL
jgi:hypothetical protein